MFVAPTRKGATLPKLADLLKTELFVVVEEGESFSARACSPCGTKAIFSFSPQSHSRFSASFQSRGLFCSLPQN